MLRLFRGYALLVTVFSSSFCIAEIQPYQSTDNTGINKLERIGVIENYLSNLSTTLKAMESKLDSTAIKLEAMDVLVKNLKDENAKLKTELTEKIGQQPHADQKEIEKLKADIMAIKNEDIEKIRIQVQGLNYSIQSVQGLLESRKSSR